MNTQKLHIIMKRINLTFISSTLIALTQSPVFGAGPIGIGELKLGMTQEQVQALKGSVELSSELSQWKPSESQNYTPEPGKKILKGMLNNPVTGKSEVTLTFTNDRLSSLSLVLDNESEMAAAKNMISSKYGSPKTDNRQRDEQCIYRNGNSFTLKNGTLFYQWEQNHGGGVVSTTISEILINTCPYNLRYGTTDGLVFRTLSIKYGPKKPDVNNLF
ncbi:hypothetical protein [Cylindrospermopsis raciborskii]|uniref:hypothetical protein n=2 Tax=Cylindrospermopsis raciborskii TaxID=77022 RepID=UPI0008DCB224|nr:hypothetical protein [Cylindrospermopsis raciborskii]NLQ05070.1 hypothetical protein [Cylindrospermopsis raciborskii MVCC19]OHY32647.1 hypothetical protein BCV64_02670 [Cylindrospermopsis raciborskii MVCC14]